jgi:hypothetical protein
VINIWKSPGRGQTHPSSFTAHPAFQIFVMCRIVSAVSDALAHHPDLTIEGFVGTPDWTDSDREELTEMMRAAGFPACAKPETLVRYPQLVRLPECQSK